MTTISSKELTIDCSLVLDVKTCAISSDVAQRENKTWPTRMVAVAVANIRHIAEILVFSLNIKNTHRVLVEGM